ncbi:MAG: YdeI/OmpD-associated family protein [Planctomycetes bacterium]|nr:YdeI/OmpD-associated family protein [Planctomycetota bacterium]MCW8136117.1 YdeI/OmpD-associated family protein [Planctomycetota bacterium]
MPRNPAVDTYIAKAADFAQPILKRIRALYHKAFPAIEEEIKWGVPAFTHKGIVGSMAAFKAHVGMAFWKGKLLKDPSGVMGDRAESAMGAVRATSVNELPADKVLIDLIQQAVALNESGIKLPKADPKKAQAKVPADFKAALAKNKQATKFWTAFSPSKKREYVEWITGAKQQATRDKRLKQAIEWIAENKPRNWKYMNC